MSNCIRAKCGQHASHFGHIGDYLFLVTTPDTDSGVCTISPVSFNISDQIDLSLEYDVTDPLCLNTDGFFSGSLDGPSGIYSVYSRN